MKRSCIAVACKRTPVAQSPYSRVSRFVFLCVWCEWWTVALKKEHKLGAFKNRVLRKILPAKMAEVMEKGA